MGLDVCDPFPVKPAPVAAGPRRRGESPSHIAPGQAAARSITTARELPAISPITAGPGRCHPCPPSAAGAVQRESHPPFPELALPLPLPRPLVGFGSVALRPQLGSGKATTLPSPRGTAPCSLWFGCCEGEA
ncbi:hypothetical protein GQ53DRAFT_753395 [Thozetella sp. PMI_491]|nr:hypothetical protein GQ53DRAFT_753395 [Thozetella sp. PMI_491]